MGSDKGLTTNKSSGRFFRLTIARKLLLGYLSLAALIVIISIYTLSSLERLNKINSSIIKTDLPLVEAADKMVDSLLAQELYGRRYAILHSQEMQNLFLERSAEFKRMLEQIRLLPDGPQSIVVQRLNTLHDEYNDLYAEGIPHLGDRGSSLGTEYDRQLRKKLDEILGSLKKISADANHDQNTKAMMTSDLGTEAFRVTWLMSISGVVFGVVSAVLIIRNISGSIRQLKIATQQISEGKFDYEPTVWNQDELGELSNAFSEMGKRLKRLEEMYLDASPLTRLPGGIAIENVLNKRLDANTPLAFCLIDLDNFKAFSDRYGYAKGSELIKATARITEEAVKKMGTEDDFIGHIGGDDFVLISLPERYNHICNAVIEAFENMVPDHYDAEDRELGYIAGHTRQGDALNFPLMTISIAVVTNRDRKYANAVEISEVAAELKEYAKSQPGSLYVVDKRKKPFHQVQHSDEDTSPPGEGRLRRRMSDA